ncbi:MAG TPA: amino acid carrier protein [Candidatus Acidoferrum sp.]|nr:amino acid carrier protein [Candidatus Acidoferrum sp.]
MTALDVVNTLSGYLWGTPLLVTVLFGGIFYTLATKFFTFRYFGHMIKHTFGTLLKKDESKEKAAGKISPFEAVAVAIGGTVGVGNIGGVSTAIATGGPGAVFWLWLWGLCGMTIKTAEVSLAVYFRSKDESGNFYGGSTYYMEKGIGKAMGLKIWKVLALIFFVGMFAGMIGGAQTYTIAEGLHTSFGIPMLPFTICYAAFIILVVWKGIHSIANFATKVVPFMCLIYLVGGVIIIAKNLGTIPHVFGMIFSDAFTGTAAVGGFAGAAFAQVVKTGVARSIYSNEAGWGSSPFAHASANTPHPVRQGLWGSFEVFVDTILVCSITALSILCAGVWDSGIMGASLAIEAYSTAFGTIGGNFITICVFLFGMTTSTGWCAYYEVMIRQLFSKNMKLRENFVKLYKLVFMLPGVYVVWLAETGGSGPELIWAIADCTNAVPTFANIVALLFLSKQFLMLLNDYKARYLGIGTVDPNFKVFYDTEDQPVAVG